MRFRIEVSGEHTQPEEARADLDKQLALFVEAIRRRGWLDDSVNVHTEVRGYDYVIVDDLVEGEKDVEWGFGVPERDEVAYGKSIMEQVVDEMDAARSDTWPTKVLVPRGTPVLSKEDMDHAEWIDPTAEEMRALAAETSTAVDGTFIVDEGDVTNNVMEVQPLTLAEKIRIAQDAAENAHLGQSELAEMFGVSRYAIRKALEQL